MTRFMILKIDISSRNSKDSNLFKTSSDNPELRTVFIFDTPQSRPLKEGGAQTFSFQIAIKL